MIPLEQYIRELLAEVYTDEGVEIWLHSRNTMLDNLVPIEMMRTPEGTERVLAVVRHLYGGGF